MLPTITVTRSHDKPNSNSHGQTSGQTPYNEADHGAHKTDEDDGLAAEPVRRSPPRHGGHALSD